MKSLILFLLCTAQSSNTGELTLEQKIGQLFAIPVPLSSPTSNLQKICATINKYNVGSVVLDRMGTLKQHVFVVNYLQQHCINPPLIAQDLENGLSMRLYDGLRFPKAQTCGAIQDDTLIYRMAQEIGRECKLLGVDINLAPVVDIITSKRSIIKERSYGEDPIQVTNKARAFITGLQSQGIYACLKHFPGLGDAVSDPHLALPIVTRDKTALMQQDLYPFIQLAPLAHCIMSAHVRVPAYDDRPYCSATLSHTIITNILRKQIGYQGLIITDALRMEALTHYFGTAQLVLESFNAGHDILLFPQSISEAVAAVKTAVEEHTIDLQEIDKRVAKIEQTKNVLGVATKRPTGSSIRNSLYTAEVLELKKHLYQAAVTTLTLDKKALSLKKDSPVAYVQIGGTFDCALAQELENYFSEISSIILEHNPRGCDINELFDSTEHAETVIVALFGTTSNSEFNYGIMPNTRIIVERLAQSKHVILVICGSPYCLKDFEYIPTIIIAYEDDPDAQQAAANVITGSLIPSGRLPVTISNRFKLGTGYLSETNKSDNIDINLIKILSDGPDVSLNGSPTVSPTTAALCASDPLPPR